MPHCSCKSNQATVRSNLVMLSFLCTYNQCTISCVSIVFSLFHHFLSFLDQSLHCRTFFSLSFFAHHLKYLLKSFNMSFSLRSVLFKSILQVFSGSVLHHFLHGFYLCFFSPVNV